MDCSNMDIHCLHTDKICSLSMYDLEDGVGIIFAN